MTCIDLVIAWCAVFYPMNNTLNSSDIVTNIITNKYKRLKHHQIMMRRKR